MLRHLIIGPGPCNFKIHKYRLFLESVCVGKQELGLVSDPSSNGHKFPPPSYSIYTALRASFRLWFLFRLKFAIAATSHTSLVFNDQTKASQNLTLINKAFHLIFAISRLQSQFLACSSFARRKQTLVVRLIVLRRGQ